MTEIRLTGESANVLLTSQSNGSGDYLVACEAVADGFAGHADGHVTGAAWYAFVDALVSLDRRRKGEAVLESALPGEFAIRIGALDSRGHMSVSGSLRYGRAEWPRQRLEFAFEFDPSQLNTARITV